MKSAVRWRSSWNSSWSFCSFSYPPVRLRLFVAAHEKGTGKHPAERRSRESSGYRRAVPRQGGPPCSLPPMGGPLKSGTISPPSTPAYSRRA